MSTQATTGDCNCQGIVHVPPCIYAAAFTTNVVHPAYNFQVSNPMMPNKEYEELTVSDEEVKYKKLAESQERHIERLEAQIESLKEELGRVGERLVEEFTPVDLTSTTIPQGIQLTSAFRADLESRLRQKALQAQEEKK